LEAVALINQLQEALKMLNRLTLAAIASLLLTAQATAQDKRQPPTAPPQKLNATLCKTEAQAIALAGLRFAEDGALGWTASWVAPFSGASLARGT
jgi:hypothetical protein